MYYDIFTPAEDVTARTKLLESIARKNNPKIHLCSDVPKLVLSRRLEEEVKAARKSAHEEQVSAGVRRTVSYMLKVRVARKEALIDRIAARIAVLRAVDAISVLELCQIFGRTDSTMLKYCKELTDDERIKSARSGDGRYRLMFYGRD